MKLLTFFCFLLYIFYFHNGFAYSKTDKKISENSPTINEKSQYSFKITGHIDESLIKLVRIDVQTRYMAYNNDCNVLINRLEGVYISPQFVEVKHIRFNQNGDFNADVMIDKYNRGKCDWRIYTIVYNVFYKDNKLPLRTYYGFKNYSSNKKIKVFKDKILCNNTKCKFVYADTSAERGVSDKKNYRLKLQVLKNANNT